MIEECVILTYTCSLCVPSIILIFTCITLWYVKMLVIW